MGSSSLPRVRGRHRRDNKWRYAAPILGYSVAAALAVVAATSAHYGQLRSEQAVSSDYAGSARAEAAPRDRAYLPQIVPDDRGEAAPPAPPAPVAPAPAPTEPAQATAEAEEPRDEVTAQPEPTDRSSAPTSTEPEPVETSAPSATEEPVAEQPTATEEPTETSEPAESPETSQPETAEPSEPSTTEEPQPPQLLKGVDGVVHGLTDPVLGLLG